MRPSNEFESQRRKRSASCRSPPPVKRLKSAQRALDGANTDIREDLVLTPDDESDAIVIDEKATVQQDIEVARVKDYYMLAFGLLGQLACKDILKAWIKHGHPKKQSKHPYNGGETRDNSIETHDFQGAFKAPEYWPEQEGWEEGKGCRHKEPDHIYKPGLRTILYMKYMICS